MKKIVSLVAIVIALFVLSTSAFAFSGAVTDATLDGTVISAKADGSFIFTYIGSMEVKGGSSIKCNVANLVNAGWTVEAVDDVWCPDAETTQSFANNLIQVKWPAGSNYDLTDAVMLQFKATPGASVDFASASFKVSPTISKAVGGLYNTATTYTLAEAAGAEAPTYTGTVNPKTTLNGIDDVYTGVWTGDYTVALNGNAITKVGLRFAEKADDAFAVAMNADGSGSVAFKIAIVGAPADAVATPIVYTSEWIAAEAE